MEWGWQFLQRISTHALRFFNLTKKRRAVLFYLTEMCLCLCVEIREGKIKQNFANSKILFSVSTRFWNKSTLHLPGLIAWIAYGVEHGVAKSPVFYNLTEDKTDPIMFLALMFHSASSSIHREHVYI